MFILYFSFYFFHTYADKDQYRDHFDQRAPEFLYPKPLATEVVRAEDDAQKQGTPEIAWGVGEPELHHYGVAASSTATVMAQLYQ